MDDERYAIRLIGIFVDGHTNNREDRAWGYVTEAPVETVEEINSGVYGEELNACLIRWSGKPKQKVSLVSAHKSKNKGKYIRNEH